MDSNACFLLPPFTYHDELNSLMGPARAESSALEEVSVEASAPKGESDEPDLGSLAALTQHIYPVTRTKWAARSHRKSKVVQRVIKAFLVSGTKEK